MNRSLLPMQMERLREMHDEGEISDAEFAREYGALARELIGDEEYEAAKRRLREAR